MAVEVIVRDINEGGTKSGVHQTRSWRLSKEEFEKLYGKDHEVVCDRLIERFPELIEVKKDHGKVIEPNPRLRDVPRRTFKERQSLLRGLIKRHPEVLRGCPLCGYNRASTSQSYESLIEDDKRWLSNLETHCLDKHYTPMHPELWIWKNLAPLVYDGKLYEKKRDIAIDFLIASCDKKARGG